MALMGAALISSQVTWALAGTTGGISGVVTDVEGRSIAGAAIRMVSASQTAASTSDASGHFVFLSLSPDTYTVSILRDGFSPLTEAGVTVFADQQITLAFHMQSALKTIANVRSTGASNLVKAGVGADVYSVNTQTISAASAMGGGGNLNSAYSAISTVAGVTVPSGNMGWNQATYVRGSQSFFTGFEYDGIPVNRAFDNYNSSTESNLGLQAVQVYTGGGPASSSSAGTSGFINQVFKTGTYPGYLSFSGGIGTPAFYHQAKVEAGGASPDRHFSYYVGLSGYNQGYRFLDNANAAGLMGPLGVYSLQSLTMAALNANNIPALALPCTAAGNDPNPLLASSAWYAADIAATGNGTALNGGSCFVPYDGTYGLTNQIADRENVANFHFRFPTKNGLTDDVQLLGSTSMMNTQFYSSPNDAGGVANYTLAQYGALYCNPVTSLDTTGANCTPAANVNYPAYVDAVVYNAPFGTPIAGLKTQNYYQPDSPHNRAPGAQIPNSLRDGIYNDTGILKLQYTHPFSSNAFARVFAYTFFSDWTQSGAESAYGCYVNGLGPCDGSIAANYDLITHTGGGQFELVDQASTAHLLQLTANVTTANVVRFNNTGFTGGSSPIGIISRNAAGVYSCWDERPTLKGAPNPAYDTTVSCVPSGSGARPWSSSSVRGPYNGGALGPNATAAGANWVTLWNGNARGSYNTVKPQFSFVSLGDEWRPDARWLINAQLRYESYHYGLVANPDAATQFYAQIIPNSVCQNASGTVLTKPLPPGVPPPAPVQYTAVCPAGYSHPAFSATSPGAYTIANLSPRLSATYTQSPDTVWRGSIGRYVEPPVSASVQYLNTSGNNLSVWTATLPLGFHSPFHPIPAMSATQADFSLERHIRGTDMTFKLSPFYNYTTGYQEQSFIGSNFATQAPVGNFRSMGMEFAFTKGDFAKDGVAAQLSATYTSAKVQYTNWFNTNQLNAVNQSIGQFNLLTKGGGGSPYYCSGGADAAGNPSPGTGSPASCASLPTPGTAITNPYYNMNPQGFLATNAWYAPGDAGLSPTSNAATTYYDTPWNFAGLVNWRKQKFAANLSLQITEGASYGGPLDVIGIDPRTCANNSLTAGITKVSASTDPYQCDALSTSGTFSNAAGVLYIPNPQTGSFATVGAFRNPWLMTGNLAFTYEMSPRISANVTLANLFHTCFGGTKAPWTSAYPAGQNICSYGANSLYVSNFYNGTGPKDLAANGVSPQPWQLNSYTPTRTADSGTPFPLNVYFQLNIK